MMSSDHPARRNSRPAALPFSGRWGRRQMHWWLLLGTGGYWWPSSSTVFGRRCIPKPGAKQAITPPSLGRRRDRVFITVASLARSTLTRGRLACYRNCTNIDKALSVTSHTSRYATPKLFNTMQSNLKDMWGKKGKPAKETPVEATVASPHSRASRNYTRCDASQLTREAPSET